MWTDEHRTTYCQSGGGFPSNLTDAQWARLEALIPPAKPGGRPRKTDMRAALNALFYLLRTGCPWRYLPGAPFPPRSTVYNIFRQFQRDGVNAHVVGAVGPDQATAKLPAVRSRIACSAG